MKLESAQQIFEKCSHIIFSKNPPFGGPNCSAQTNRQTVRQTGLTKLTVFFRKFSKAPKKITEHNRMCNTLSNAGPNRGQATKEQPGGALCLETSAGDSTKN